MQLIQFSGWTNISACFSLCSEEYALNMVDSWGKPQSGLLYGNHQWLGSYDQCLEQQNDTIIAKYYLVQATDL